MLNPILFAVIYLSIIFCASEKLGDCPAMQNLNLSSQASSRNGKEILETSLNPSRHKLTVNVAIVICGSKRLSETMTMLKSVVIASRGVNLNIIIVADGEALKGGLKTKLYKLHSQFEIQRLKFSYKFYQPWFPDLEGGNFFWLHGEWSPCMSQRLFFPTLLQNVDSVIYLDLDTLVFTSLSEIWNYFNQMSSQQMIGMMRHSELSSRHSYYRVKNKLPYYGHTGLDSGVMLMNLTRMRDFKFERKIIELKNKYNQDLVLPDQDLLNVLFHYETDKIFLLPCHTNFHLGHCDSDDPGGACLPVEREGVAILHGTGRSFKNDKMPFIKRIYETMENYDPAVSSDNLLEHLKSQFKCFTSPCFQLTAEVLFSKFERHLKNTSK